MNNKTTLGELRFLFNAETVVYLIPGEWSGDEVITKADRIKISDNNLLWGTTGFSEIPVYFNHVYATGKNKVEIEVNMPIEIFRAWAEYARKND